MDFNSFIKLMKVILIALLGVGWLVLAVWGIFKSIPVTPENWWLLCLSILVILCSLFFVFTALSSYDQPGPHSFWDTCTEWIGFLPLKIFLLVDGYFNTSKEPQETWKLIR